MSFSLFGWTFGQPAAPRADVSTPPSAADGVDTDHADHAHEGKVCPPCTGCCYQGRACPQSARADAALISWMRRSTLR